MSQPDSIPPPDHQLEIDRIRQVYEGTYKTQTGNRTYIWHPRNPVSLYYRHALEKALIELFNTNDLVLDKYRVLDVGCGMGNFLRFLVSLQANPHKLFGIDLMSYRITGAKEASPSSITYMVGDAAQLPYAADSFDMVSQFTVFSSILESSLRRQVALEMSRVANEGAYILWYDMDTPQQKTTRGVDLKELLDLFSGCQVVSYSKLHTRYSARIARRSQVLAGIWDRLPGIPKTHYLALLQNKSPV